MPTRSQSQRSPKETVPYSEYAVHYHSRLPRSYREAEPKVLLSVFPPAKCRVLASPRGGRSEKRIGTLMVPGPLGPVVAAMIHASRVRVLSMISLLALLLAGVPHARAGSSGPAPTSVVDVPPGGDLQAALNAAQSGDTIR